MTYKQFEAIAKEFRPDVTIRCYLLPSVIAEVVAELDI